jgi:uncharacterized protein YgiM (DUF1202 family)
MSATEPAATEPAAAAPGVVQAPPPPAAPAEARGGHPRPARWLDRATALLLAGALALAVAAAVPSLLRVAGVELPIVEAPAPTGRIAVPHPSPEILSHPVTVGDPTRPGVPPAGEVGGSERIRRDPNSKLPPRFTDEPNPWVPAEPQDDDAEPRRDPLEYSLPSLSVVLSGPLWLHEQPLDSAKVVGIVQPGQKVTVMTERGAWAIVTYTVGDDQRAGWAKKSEIAVR